MSAALIHPLCEPHLHAERHDYHWLVFSGDGVCDLWRWQLLQRRWDSLLDRGASFTPEQMHAQGWRYYGPVPRPMRVLTCIGRFAP